MNDTVPAQPPSTLKRSGKSVGYILVALAVVGAVVLVTPIIPRHVPSQPVPETEPNGNRQQTQIDTLAHRVTVLENRLESLDVASPTVAAVPSPEKTDKDTATSLAHMQVEITSLSAAMTALHTEVKATDIVAVEARNAAAGFVTSFAAFMQLRDAANVGHGFVKELAAMRDAAKNHASVLAICARLEPFSAEGIPTEADLYEELRANEKAAETAIAKSEAQTWWQRVTAQLRGLISVRPLQGEDAGNRLARVEEAFVSNGAKAALEAVQHLPPEAQASLAVWRKKLETHEQVMDDIMQIPSQLATQPTVKTP